MSLTRNIQTSDNQASSINPSARSNANTSPSQGLASNDPSKLRPMANSSQQSSAQAMLGNDYSKTDDAMSVTREQKDKQYSCHLDQRQDIFQTKPGSALTDPTLSSKMSCASSRLSISDETTICGEEVSLKERFTKIRGKYVREESSEEDDHLHQDDAVTTTPCKRCRFEVTADNACQSELMNDCSEDSCSSQPEQTGFKATSGCHLASQSSSTFDEKENDYYRRRADDKLKKSLLGFTSSTTAPGSYNNIEISSNFWFKDNPFQKPATTSTTLTTTPNQNFPTLAPISKIVAATTSTASVPAPSSRPEDLVENYHELLASLVTRASVRSTRINLKSINLVRKETLLNLIDRNRANSLLAPFDMFASIRIKAKQNNEFLVNSMNNLNLRCQSSDKESAQLNASAGENAYQGNTYNYTIIHKLSKLRKYYKPNDRNYMKENSLLINCVSSYLMPFFFDIFNASELQSFNKETVDMLLLLKRSYKAQENVDYELISSNYIENILWNCFALYKFKFDDDKQTRMGFLNYYLTYLSLLNEFQTLHKRSIENPSHDQQQQGSSTKSHAKKYEELNAILPFLLESLVLNGLFKSSDLTQFQNFYTIKRLTRPSSTSSRQSARHWHRDRSSDENVEQAYEELNLSANDRLSVDLIPNEQSTGTSSFEDSYLDNSIRRLISKEETSFPLKLKDLCRINIKKSLKEFTSESVNQLNIPNAMKPFLLFDDEVSTLFRSNKRFINLSASKCSWY